MRVEVLHIYQRRPSAGVYIEPGVYEDGDERLCGVPAAFLVENGHGKWVDTPSPDAEITPPEPEDVDVLSDGENIPTARIRRQR